MRKVDQFKQNQMEKEDIFQLLSSAVIKETIEQFVKNRAELLKELFRIPGVDEECIDGDDELITDEGEK